MRKILKLPTNAKKRSCVSTNTNPGHLVPYATIEYSESAITKKGKTKQLMLANPNVQKPDMISILMVELNITNNIAELYYANCVDGI